MRKSAPIQFGSLKARPPLAMPGQRIGLLGGSFNPPHEGHVRISRMALKRLGLARVWWIVTPGNPLKQRSELAPLAQRMAACRAICNDARIIATDFEKDLPTPFTAGTIAFLRRRYRSTRFVWIMGADNLASFHRWRDWQGIFASLPIAVLDRPGSHLQALASRAGHLFGASRHPEPRSQILAGHRAPAWTFLSGPLSPLSSTALRRAHAPMRGGRGSCAPHR